MTQIVFTQMDISILELIFKNIIVFWSCNQVTLATEQSDRHFTNILQIVFGCFVLSIMLNILGSVIELAKAIVFVIVKLQKVDECFVARTTREVAEISADTFVTNL